MSIKFKYEVEIDDYDDAVMFLKDNNWDLSVIPEEQQREILKLVHNDGWTVAHRMAAQGYKFLDSEIQKITDENGGWTVAHEMASKRYKFEDPEILKLANNDGWTVAHIMAVQDHKFTNSEILKLANNKGWAVAHTMALKGDRFYDPEILKLVDDDGATVADFCDRLYNTGKFNKILQEAEEESRPGMG